MASVRQPVTLNRGERIKIEPLGLCNFNDRRNRLLIIRATGGLGDILMHRMLFEDFKLLIPEIKITFAIPQNYWPAVEDHPFIDEIVDSNNVDARDFLISYTTTTACGRHESKVAPFADKNRSDIWAYHCGINLTKHNMHIRLRPEEIKDGKNLLEPHANNRPIALISPISAMKSKNMNAEQMNGTARELRKMGFSPLCIHNAPIPEMSEAPVVVVKNIRSWMGAIYAADMVVSVDTATFHCAGGMKKPLVGMFTWADGLIYGKWYDFALVQKHRVYTPGWGCGPCYNWHDCPKCPELNHRKPCLSELSVDDIMAGVVMLFNRWPQMRPKGLTISNYPASVNTTIVINADSKNNRLPRVELAVLAS